MKNYSKLHKKGLPGSESYKMSIVGRSGNTNRPGAPHVRVAQLVGQLLQLVSLEVVVIPQHVVVAGTRGSLDTCKIIGFKKSTAS